MIKMTTLYSRGKVLIFLTFISTFGFISSLYYFVSNNLLITNKLPVSFIILMMFLVSCSHMLGHLIEYQIITNNYMHNKIK